MSASLLPWWLTIGPIALMMIVVAAHMVAIGRLGPGDEPASRRRVRLANGGVILILLPVLFMGFSIVTPDDRRAWLLTWLSAMGLLAIVIVLAGLDLLNTARLSAKEAIQLRRAQAQAAQEALEVRALMAARRDGATSGRAGTAPLGSGDAPKRDREGEA